MFSVTFDEPSTFKDERALRDAFGSDRLYLSGDANVMFEGRIDLGPEVAFSGNCSLGSGCVVEQGSILADVCLGPRNRVRAYSVLRDLTAGENNLLGPFCFLRDGCIVADRCILGAHVEAARSRFASGVRISHRAFVGDADIGEDSIVGAGVVFCNYDGYGRQATRIGARVTLGSGALLVPPLTIEDDALIAAGSLINKDVPAGGRIIQKRR
jgi:bifunctional UDP-N-acetylglucosamine pyrophosphorylase/glucosamine-1-phosphate N-acetyltransferase